VKVDVGGLSAAEIEAKVAEMVQRGESMPRSLHQSVEPLLQKSVVE
jgi:hypothetical protein